MKKQNLKSNNNQPNKAFVGNARLCSLNCLQQVYGAQSLNTTLTKNLDKLNDPRNRALANEIINGVLRWRWSLDFFITQLLAKPLKKKDDDIQIILQIALYEIIHCRTPEYAVINEAVSLVKKIKKTWAAGLVNAVLRRYLREQKSLQNALEKSSAKYAHPDWLLNKIKHDWPHNWCQIITANNQAPDLWLRVNQLQTTTADYLKQLKQVEISAKTSDLCEDALMLSQGVNVTTLPNFANGFVAVQDIGAQLCAQLLNLKPQQTVLDCCAAPGGKTCHLLEQDKQIKKLVVVENDDKRMLRVTENLQRLKLTHQAEIVQIVADVKDYKNWWNQQTFDRILLDAPCSASGVIRRHPDIKSLRREDDIAPLVKLQFELLLAAWHMLKVGGELLYVTCSIFHDENQNQIKKLLQSQHNAVELDLETKSSTTPQITWGQKCLHGRQLLPGEQHGDGFYFCRLTKR